MSKISLRQLSDYFFLLFITGSSVILVLLANGNKQMIRYIIFGLALMYIIWGIIHHKKERTLNKEIVFEYTIVSLLGSALVIGLL